MSVHEVAPRRSAALRSRPLGLVLLFVTVGGLLAYLVLKVPVAAPLPGGRTLWFCRLYTPPVPSALREQYGWVALGGAAIVASADALVLLVTFGYRRGIESRSRRARPAIVPDGFPSSRRPTPLRLERVPLRVAWITAAASLTLLLAGALQGYAMWVWVGMGLLPWVPLVAFEAVWKYEHYGLWAVFGVATLLQIGHIGEHTVQVTQLMLYHGQLAQSHGIFGQLDFETVHFFWDSAVWLCLCLLLPRFSRGNRWLWVAFAAASVHEVEHLYLFYVYKTDPTFYVNGGLAGIMGYDGVIGSPLARPYLHFAYNFLVVVPMVLAFWDQSKQVHARPRSRHGRDALGISRAAARRSGRPRAPAPSPGAGFPAR
jgi:hypothetical protein